jgi:type I restriction enzyme R subunit
MVQRMADNDGIVTRYMDDLDFQKTIFPILAKEIYNSVLEKAE